MEWTEHFRRHEFHDGDKRIGCVRLSPEGEVPLIYFGFCGDISNLVWEAFPILKAAKQWVEVRSMQPLPKHKD
jgi:hypothetical protein